MRNSARHAVRLQLQMLQKQPLARMAAHCRPDSQGGTVAPTITTNCTTNRQLCSNTQRCLEIVSPSPAPAFRRHFQP
jgi:hypothetical protein